MSLKLYYCIPEIKINDFSIFRPLLSIFICSAVLGVCDVYVPLVHIHLETRTVILFTVQRILYIRQN